MLKKGIISYIIATVCTAIIGYIYTLFGHGVSSTAMTFMFIYPVIGCLIYIVINRLHYRVHRTYLTSFDRLSLLSHHLGILTLTVGSFLKGILDIAGTGSIYVGAFYLLGGILIFGSIGATLYKVKQHPTIVIKQ